MKPLLIAAAVVFTATPGPFNLLQKIGGDYPTLAACEAAAASQPVGTFTCHNSVTVVTKTVPDPVMHGGIAIDASTFMAPYNGQAVDLLAATTEVAAPSADGSGDFRTACLPSHMSFDDPIVYPGKPGMAHGHIFFGNSLTSAASTATSIATTGGSTCRGGTVNRTAYWSPIVVDTAHGNAAVKSAGLGVYYKTGYVLPASWHAQIVAIPQGLRMIAGDPTLASKNEWGPAFFRCDNDGPYYWSLGDLSASGTCGVGHRIWMSVVFPQCWDGVNLDSADHKSHMAYPTGSGCPADHPKAIPEITMHVWYDVPAEGFKAWRLASDAYDASLPAGYSLHADYFMGWKPDIAQAWTSNCINRNLDCLAHLLGDGRLMQEFDGN